MQTFKMTIRMRIAAPWLAMQFGPARALQSKLVLAATEETYLSSCWYGGRQPASCERVLTPSTTTGTAVSFPRNAAADCCSNSFTVQLLLRQVVRRNCESVHSRSAGRSLVRLDVVASKCGQLWLWQVKGACIFSVLGYAVKATLLLAN